LFETKIITTIKL